MPLAGELAIAAAPGAAPESSDLPAFFPNGDLLFSGSSNPGRRLYRVPLGRGLVDAEHYLEHGVANGNLYAPHVSSNGAWVAFTSTIGGDPALHLYNVATGRVDRLTSSAAPEYNPTVCGGEVWFVRRDVEGFLYRVPVTGGTAERVSDDVALGGGVACDDLGRVAWYARTGGTDELVILDGDERRVIASGMLTHRRPALAPDGSWIAWVERTDLRTVLLADPHTDEVVAVDTGTASVVDIALGIAGDRTKLAFTHYAGGGPRQLTVLDITDEAPPLR